MTVTSETAGAARRPWRRRAAAAIPYVLLAALLLGVGWLTADRRSGGPPLDPESTAADGTRALVETLERLGADVEVSGAPPDTTTDSVLVLADDLDEPTRDGLRGWAADGGTLVVADPESPLVPEVVGATAIGIVDATLPRRCDVAALDGVARVAAPGGVVFETTPRAAACFPRGQGHWLVATPAGDGVVVALGGPGAFVNANLGEADNAALLASLLLPVDGAVVRLQQPPLPGSGDTTLFDLVPRRVLLALLQLGIAFLVVVAWRARRLGRPVTEVQAVALPGSELTVAVGALLHETGARAQAATVLREDLRRTLAERFGVPPGAPDETLADTVAARSDVDRGAVLAVLRGQPPADEQALIDLAGEVDRVRDAALAPQRPSDDASQPPARSLTT